MPRNKIFRIGFSYLNFQNEFRFGREVTLKNGSLPWQLPFFLCFAGIITNFTIKKQLQHVGTQGFQSNHSFPLSTRICANVFDKSVILTNLKYLRYFYELFPITENRQQVVDELPEDTIRFGSPVVFSEGYSSGAHEIKVYPSENFTCAEFQVELIASPMSEVDELEDVQFTSAGSVTRTFGISEN